MILEIKVDEIKRVKKTELKKFIALIYKETISFPEYRKILGVNFISLTALKNMRFANIF